MKTAVKYSPIDFASGKDRLDVQRGSILDQAITCIGSNRLIDLSHLPKWDIQGPRTRDFPFPGIDLPPKPGECVLRQNLLVGRMNAGQFAVWDLEGTEPEPPVQFGLTEKTSGLALLAVCGPRTLSLMERISNLDLTAPDIETPRLFQGPVLSIPCLVVLLARNEASATVLIAFSRGYGQAFAHTILEVGSDLDFKPQQVVPV